jgi:hypothetical protein
VIWPTIDQERDYTAGVDLSASAKAALYQYLKGDVKRLDKGVKKLKHATYRQRIIAGLVLMLVIMPSRAISALLPGGWILDPLFRRVEKHVLGLHLMEFIRIASLSDMIIRATGVRLSGWFSQSSSVI